MKKNNILITTILIIFVVLIFVIIPARSMWIPNYKKNIEKAVHERAIAAEFEMLKEKINNLFDGVIAVNYYDSENTLSFSGAWEDINGMDEILEIADYVAEYLKKEDGYFNFYDYKCEIIISEEYYGYENQFITIQNFKNNKGQTYYDKTNDKIKFDRNKFSYMYMNIMTNDSFFYDAIFNEIEYLDISYYDIPEEFLKYKSEMKIYSNGYSGLKHFPNIKTLVIRASNSNYYSITDSADNIKNVSEEDIQKIKTYIKNEDCKIVIE